MAALAPPRLFVPHSRPTLPADGYAEALAALSPGWVADGPCVRRFEERLAPLLGGTDAAAVGSGTAALHLALVALGIGEGDEVIIPSYVCTAVLNAVRHAGATPVLADVEPDGFNLSAADAARKITRRTRALIVPHMFGMAADMDSLLGLDVPIIEDCAQALGGKWKEQPLGSLGVGAVVSCYATKVITTGEGGAFAAREPARVAAVRDLRDYDGKEDGRVRFSCKMSELQAALGLWQLDRLSYFLNLRDKIREEYNACLSDLPVNVPRFRRGDICYRYVVRVPGGAAEAIRGFQARGVDAKRPVHRPLHHLIGGDCPQTDRLYHEAVSLPVYPSLTRAELERVLDAAQVVFGGHASHRFSASVALQRSAR